MDEESSSESSDERLTNNDLDSLYDPANCIITTRSDDEDEFFDCDSDANGHRDLFQEKQTKLRDVLEEHKSNLKLMCLAVLQYIERTKIYLADPTRFDLRIFMLKNTMFLEKMIQDNKHIFFLNNLRVVDGDLHLCQNDEDEAMNYSKNRNKTTRTSYLQTNTAELRQYLIESATLAKNEALNSETAQKEEVKETQPSQDSKASTAKRRRSEESCTVNPSRKRPCQIVTPHKMKPPEEATKPNSPQNQPKTTPRKSVKANEALKTSLNKSQNQSTPSSSLNQVKTLRRKSKRIREGRKRKKTVVVNSVPPNNAHRSSPRKRGVKNKTVKSLPANTRQRNSAQPKRFLYNDGQWLQKFATSSSNASL